MHWPVFCGTLKFEPWCQGWVGAAEKVQELNESGSGPKGIHDRNDRAVFGMELMVLHCT